MVWRPSENTEIHVFRAILQTSLDKNACTRSVISAGPMSLASELLSDAVGDDSHVDTATFEQTGDPLLLIGRASGQRS